MAKASPFLRFADGVCRTMNGVKKGQELHNSLLEKFQFDGMRQCCGQNCPTAKEC